MGQELQRVDNLPEQVVPDAWNRLDIGSRVRYTEESYANSVRYDLTTYEPITTRYKIVYEGEIVGYTVTFDYVMQSVVLRIDLAGCPSIELQPGEIYKNLEVIV